ncbi:MAG: glycosyltransferase family 39 protein, partial [Phycisphaerae bacterium]|nr:glycosyltransferase family 39 protein [Phycisphaerae bacterium]
LLRFITSGTGKKLDGFLVCSGCAVGLWILSTVTLGIGASLGLGAMWIWWAILAVGVLLGILQILPHRNKISIPPSVSLPGCGLIILGVCLGVWLAGAVAPPGTIGLTNAYDVLEYHLQVPREFIATGRIVPLNHNAYSYYPLGVEMLFLQAMQLRGGAYEGMYLAKMMHGMFGVLCVAGLVTGFGAAERKRGWFTALMVATAPGLLALSWLGFVELGMICYLTFALLWLRRWMRDGSLRNAAVLGIMCGAACCTKYLSIGLVVAPIVIVMLACSLRSLRRVGGIVAVVAITLLLFSPWLIRNTVHTGNPVFPLGTQMKIFGAGHWPPEVQQRWENGHGAANLPPVPQPADWQPKSHQPTRLDLLRTNLLTNPEMGLVVMFIALVSVCAMLASPQTLSRFSWEWALLAIFVLQAAAWLGLSHNAPARFIMPAIIPIALIAAGGLGRLCELRLADKRTIAIPISFRRDGGFVLAAAVIIAAVIVNLTAATNIFHQQVKRPLPPAPAKNIADLIPSPALVRKLPQGSRVMLVGDAKGFYFPTGTIYATVFDVHPLDELARNTTSDAQLRVELQKMGVTHLLFNWPEIRRLSYSCGFPAALSDGFIDAPRGNTTGWTSRIIQRLTAAGAQARYYPTPVPLTLVVLDPGVAGN